MKTEVLYIGKEVFKELGRPHIVSWEGRFGPIFESILIEVVKKLYSQRVIDHSMRPQNVGLMLDADGEGSVGDSICEDDLTFFVKAQFGKITDISFLAFGCTALIATSSMITVLAKGKSLEEALQITEEDVINALDGLPEDKMHCPNLGITALRKAIHNYLIIRGIGHSQYDYEVSSKAYSTLMTIEV